MTYGKLCSINIITDQLDDDDRYNNLVPHTLEITNMYRKPLDYVSID